MSRWKTVRVKVFWAKVIRDPHGCWIWRGRINDHGYGIYADRMAHRISYELVVGPIPDGLEIDHLCCNTKCVRPEHLEPVTSEENVRRRYARQTHCKHGHPLSADNLVASNTTRRCCLTCRRRFSRESAARRRAGRAAA